MKIRQLIKWFNTRNDNTSEMLARIYSDAHKFHVNSDNIPIEIYEKALEYTSDLFSKHIVALPFNECVFEVTSLGDDIVYWILVVHKNPTVTMTVCIRKNDGNFAFPLAFGTIFDPDYPECPVGEIHVEYKGTAELRDRSITILNTAFCELKSFLGLLATGTGVIQTVIPVKDKHMNNRRIRAGKLPLDYEHTTIRIDPTLLRLPGLVAAGGHHASPRLHWRRGHVRTLGSGRAVAVKPCIVGDVSNGVVTHDYVIGRKS